MNSAAFLSTRRAKETVRLRYPDRAGRDGTNTTFLPSHTQCHINTTMADSDDEYERDERAADNAKGRKKSSRNKKKRSHENPEDDDAGGVVPKEEGGGSGRGGGGGKKKKKKVKVMEESGQTDEERRALRREQRQLQHKILTSETGAQLEDPNADAFEEIRGENNELFEKVRYTREAVMDGENLQYISDRTARQVDKLVQVCYAFVFDFV